MKKWKLNESNFTILDRFKIAKFFISKNNFWTMDTKVQDFEKEMADFIGVKHAIYVSSGSTANTALAYYVKDNLATSKKNTIVLPSTTWITSVSPFLREGLNPSFIDISLNDLSMDLDKLENLLKQKADEIACVFVTSLLGISPDVKRIKALQSKYKVRFMLDNCENTFSTYKGKNISSYFTSTTSTYFGHQIQSVEGGFIFTNSDKEKDYFLMCRNHGMTRSLDKPQKYQNKLVDSKFDFNLLGNNFRNTEPNAYIGSLDLKRVNIYKSKRLNSYIYFKSLTEDNQAIIHFENEQDYVNYFFCIPLIFKDKKNKDKIQKYCNNNAIESRPIISGNLLRQTCLKGLGSYKKYKNSELLNNNGFYVGLHNKVKECQIRDLAKEINKL